MSHSTLLRAPEDVCVFTETGVTSASAKEYMFLSRFMVASRVWSSNTGTSFTGRTVTVTTLVLSEPAGSFEDDNPTTNESLPRKFVSGVYVKNAFPGAYPHVDVFVASEPPHAICTSPCSGSVMTRYESVGKIHAKPGVRYSLLSRGVSSKT